MPQKYHTLFHIKGHYNCERVLGKNPPSSSKRRCNSYRDMMRKYHIPANVWEKGECELEVVKFSKLPSKSKCSPIFKVNHSLLSSSLRPNDWLLFGVSATIFANNLFSKALENLTALVKCKNCESKGTQNVNPHSIFALLFSTRKAHQKKTRTSRRRYNVSKSNFVHPSSLGSCALKACLKSPTHHE